MTSLLQINFMSMFNYSKDVNIFGGTFATVSTSLAHTGLGETFSGSRNSDSEVFPSENRQPCESCQPKCNARFKRTL